MNFETPSRSCDLHMQKNRTILTISVVPPWTIPVKFHKLGSSI